MKRFSSEQRYSAYYAVLFGSIGAMMPFAALWMNHLGIEPAMIGLIVAAPSVAMLFTTVALGRWADSLADRRLAIIVGNWVILCAHLVLFVFASQWVVMLVWLVAGICMYAKVPITDAAALSLARRNGSDFARVRMFGSIGFMLALTLAGYIYEFYGVGVFITVALVANLSRLMVAYALPKNQRVQAKSADDTPANSPSDTGLYKKAILLTLVGGALINASHSVINTYAILLWTQQGISESTASQAIALGVAVEVALMWWFRSLTRNVSARACLLVAAACGLLRWSLLADQTSVAVIFAAQALHGITFGVSFLACASFISRRVPEESAARGQSLLATITTGCMAVATFSCGQLFDSLGSSLYWGMAGLCLLATAAVAASYRFPLSDSK